MLHTEARCAGLRGRTRVALTVGEGSGVSGGSKKGAISSAVTTPPLRATAPRTHPQRQARPTGKTQRLSRLQDDELPHHTHDPHPTCP